MSSLFDFDTQEYQRRLAQLQNLQNRSMSMPRPTTTVNNHNNLDLDDTLSDISTSPRRSTDIDRLHNSYLGGHVDGTPLLNVPDWHYEEKAYRWGSNNNHSWSYQSKAEESKGFRRDPFSRKVALKSRASTSRCTENTDNRTGLTIRSVSRTNSSESTFHRSVSDSSTCRSRDIVTPPVNKEKEKKKKKKNKFLSFFGFGRK